MLCSLYSVLPPLPSVCKPEWVCLLSDVTSVILIIQMLRQEWSDYAKNLIPFILHWVCSGAASCTIMDITKRGEESGSQSPKCNFLLQTLGTFFPILCVPLLSRDSFFLF